MVELNFTFVIFTASFIVFLFLMKLTFFDPVKDVIISREKMIEADLAESQKALEKINSAKESENPINIIKKSKLEAQEIVNKSANEANKERQEMVNRELKTIQANAETTILELRKEEKKIFADLDKYVTELSKTALDKIMSELDAHARA